MATEKLYDAWAKRNPQWEIRYEENIIKNFCEYGKGATSLRDARGKIFGAGYEIIIVAFFIGLYFDERRPLNPDSSKLKGLGQAIQFWGNIDSVKGRKPYPKLREYIFAALVAKTDIDLIAVEKGEITLRKAVDMLMDTMEEYINWGLHFMEDKLIDNPNFFYTETAFLEVFLNFDAPIVDSDDAPDSLDEEPESLDEEREAPNPTKRRPRIGQKIEPRKNIY